MNYSIIIPLIAVMVLYTILAVILLYNVLKKKPTAATSVKKEISEERLKLILSNDNIIDKINNIIDKLISDAADMYMILNVNYKQDHYINADETETMKLYIYGTVKKNMTDSIKEMISLIYDISDDKKLEDLLLFRIKIYMISVIVNNHTPS